MTAPKAQLEWRKKNKQQMNIDLEPGEKERYKQAAEHRGQKLAPYIKSLIEADITNMEREKEGN